MKSVPVLSVIVPLYNEEENVGRLFDALVSALEKMGESYEIIFVDDGSSDATFSLARELAQRHSSLRVIKFRRNCGQTPAMAAGIDYATGQILVTMDGDLQNDPDDIGRLVAKIREGFDMVVGWRYKRQDKLITRKIPSRIANWLIGKVTGVPIMDNGCSLKAYRAELIKRIPLYSEMHRFIPAMSSVAGPRIAELKVMHHPRRFGNSKYGLSRIYKVLLDLLAIKTIISFSSKPLVWFGLIGLLPTIAAVVFFGAIVEDVMSGHEDYLAVKMGAGLVFISGAAFLFMCGVLGELIHGTGTTTNQHFPDERKITKNLTNASSGGFSGEGKSQT